MSEEQLSGALQLSDSMKLPDLLDITGSTETL
jgi:hypothetical protein